MWELVGKYFEAAICAQDLKEKMYPMREQMGNLSSGIKPIKKN